MTSNNFIEKINSENAKKVFAEIYGEDERERYSVLVKEVLNGGFPKNELCNSVGDLRIFSAPGRTELAGNHTDHNRGKVLAAAIKLDSIAVVQQRNDNTVFLRSAGFPDVKLKLTDSNGAPDFLPKPQETGTTSALVRGIAAELHRRSCPVGGFSANISSTVLPGSGLSSSASIEVLLCRIFDSLYNDKKSLTPLEAAQIGQFAENEYFGKPCGLMDQTACSVGGAVAIDFENESNPIVKQINFDLAAMGFSLCIVDTGGSHADLTPDYAAVPAEMKQIAALFGKSVLRELDKQTILSDVPKIREAAGDRALLRAIHFFDENERVDEMAHNLTKIEKADSDTAKQEALKKYLDLVNESGQSSWELLQNVFSPKNPAVQGISTALALTRDFFRKHKITSACRVHGGGFAGTIQTYIPLCAIDAYRAYMDAVFGAGSVTPLQIRAAGAIELVIS